MTEPLTKEEHIARAMLMGMFYNETYYYYVDTNRRSTINRDNFLRLDPNTLEELNIDKAVKGRARYD